ncbi:hypothetical protein D3C76_742380 [compost metagenome]
MLCLIITIIIPAGERVRWLSRILHRHIPGSVHMPSLPCTGKPECSPPQVWKLLPKQHLLSLLPKPLSPNPADCLEDSAILAISVILQIWSRSRALLTGWAA